MARIEDLKNYVRRANDYYEQSYNKKLLHELIEIETREKYEVLMIAGLHKLESEIFSSMFDKSLNEAESLESLVIAGEYFITNPEALARRNSEEIDNLNQSVTKTLTGGMIIRVDTNAEMAIKARGIALRLYAHISDGDPHQLVRISAENDKKHLGIPAIDAAAIFISKHSALKEEMLDVIGGLVMCEDGDVRRHAIKSLHHIDPVRARHAVGGFLDSLVKAIKPNDSKIQIKTRGFNTLRALLESGYEDKDTVRFVIERSELFVNSVGRKNLSELFFKIPDRFELIANALGKNKNR